MQRKQAGADATLVTTHAAVTAMPGVLRGAHGASLAARLLLMLGLLITVAGGVLPGHRTGLVAAAGIGPTVKFDWTMPDRFGLDRDGDGLLDYDVINPAYLDPPNGWAVTLDASGSTGD